MEQTLGALVGILQKAVPTILLLILLHFYLKAMLFGPLAKVMKERDALTKGTRKNAEESLASAERKTAEYEARLREARGEVYREQEELRRQWLTQQTQQIDAARERNSAAVQEAKAKIVSEKSSAYMIIAAGTNDLADQIANSILNRRAQ